MSLLNDECAANHLPAWTEGIAIDAFSIKEYNVLIAHLDNYNANIEKLETCDPFEAFGVEAEQEELIRLMMVIYNQYKPKEI